MQYNRISADCHLDLPWMPPGSSEEDVETPTDLGIVERMLLIAEQSLQFLEARILYGFLYLVFCAGGRGAGAR